MVIIDNKKAKEAEDLYLSVGDDALVEISENVFPKARLKLRECDCVIAVSDTKEPLFIMRQEPSTYVHEYRYAGGLDLWFLDQYDCLFLHDCNEYSVELCLSALRLWKGKRLVLIGGEWEYLLPFLPELEGIECLLEDVLTEEGLEALSQEYVCLHVVTGVPFEERMDRYEMGIMTYDEVMSFTYMFANRESNGTEHPDKHFFVIDARYGNLGLFGIYYKAIAVAAYAKKCGFVPVLCIENKYGQQSIYQNNRGDDLWEKFYCQPEGYGMEDIRNAQNVTYSPFFYNARIMQTLMERRSAGTKLTWPDGIYNERVKLYLAEREKRFLPYPDKTLGVLARGTDYIGTELANHPIHASKEMIADKIDECLREWQLDYIFLATEDETYCNWFAERYPKIIFYTDQERYQTAPGEMLAEMHRHNGQKRDGFLLGVDYVLAIDLLSKCNSFLASGDCTGVGEARRMRDKPFAHEYVFDLGKRVV